MKMKNLIAILVLMSSTSAFATFGTAIKGGNVCLVASFANGAKNSVNRETSFLFIYRDRSPGDHLVAMESIVKHSASGSFANMTGAAANLVAAGTCDELVIAN